MNKVFGKISDFSPVREDGSRVIISYGFEAVDEENATWQEVYLYKKQQAIVTLDVVKQAIIGDINAQTDAKILSGFVWGQKPVWLSSENQFNFKAAYDVAVQTEGESLPVKFKLGEQEDGTPVYHTFTSLSAFTDFYTQAIAYIQQQLTAGWQEKDAIDWSPYEALFPAAEAESGTASE